MGNLMPRPYSRAIVSDLRPMGYNACVPASLYLHIPFCTHRCAYCDFNTYAGQEGSIPAYVEALIQEIKYVGPRASTSLPLRYPSGSMSARVHTIFFGGGTPSLLSGPQFTSVMEALRSNFDF